MRVKVAGKIFRLLLVLLCSSFAFAQQTPGPTALWQDRGDISTLDLTNFQAGKPPGTKFTFIKESLDGTAPKFEVEDENGVKWKVKLGTEAKPETAATCLVWAAGYHVDEDYYRPEIRVEGMKRLSRGRRFVHGDRVLNVRLERHHKDADHVNWSWYENPFTGTREFNGLRVMMALINNWDLKSINNTIVDEPDGPVYEVADLGAVFGNTGNVFTRSKGVVKDYARADFIERVTPTSVDFVMHSRPFFLSILTNFRNYFFRTKMERIAKHIPIDDVRWIGNRLAPLSEKQVGDCFRGGGFSETEVSLYTRTVLQRIAALKNLTLETTGH